MRRWVLNVMFVCSVIVFITGIISLVSMFNLRSRYSLGYDTSVVSVGDSIELELKGYDDKIDTNRIEWQVWGIDNCSVEVSEDKSHITLTGVRSGLVKVGLVYQGGILGKASITVLSEESENTLSKGGVFS